MRYTVKLDKQSCLSSGRCVEAAPGAFAFDDDHLAEPAAGASQLPLERLLAVARACPAVAISILDENGAEIELG